MSDPSGHIVGVNEIVPPAPSGDLAGLVERLKNALRAALAEKA